MLRLSVLSKLIVEVPPTVIEVKIDLVVCSRSQPALYCRQMICKPMIPLTHASRSCNSPNKMRHYKLLVSQILTQISQRRRMLNMTGSHLPVGRAAQLPRRPGSTMHSGLPVSGQNGYRPTQ